MVGANASSVEIANEVRRLLNERLSSLVNSKWLFERVDEALERRIRYEVYKAIRDVFHAFEGTFVSKESATDLVESYTGIILRRIQSNEFSGSERSSYI